MLASVGERLRARRQEPPRVLPTLPDEVWVHIFSFLNYPRLCSVRLVCRNFYYLSQEEQLGAITPSWSRLNIHRRRIDTFHRLLHARPSPPAPTVREQLRQEAWKGIPRCLRGTVYLTLLGYLPTDSQERLVFRAAKRREYETLQRNRQQADPTEASEEFERYLHIDLGRHLRPYHADVLAMTHSCLQLFHHERGCLYYSHFSLHFPLLLALYMERVIAHEQISPSEAEMLPFDDLLSRELPLEVRQDLEVDFYYGFVASFSGLKAQGVYSANDRPDHSFVLQTLSRVDQLIQAFHPDLSDHFLQQGIYSIMFLHNWVALCFFHTFQTEVVLRSWDALLSENRRQGATAISTRFLIFLCVAIVLQYAPELKSLPSDSIMQFFFGGLRDRMNTEQLDMILARAYLISQRNLLPSLFSPDEDQ